jgi:tRNA(adenine34) deaminase
VTIITRGRFGRLSRARSTTRRHRVQGVAERPRRACLVSRSRLRSTAPGEQQEQHRPDCYYGRPMEFEALMAAALEEAHRARDAGEVPIGALVALDGAIVGRGFNQPISSGDPTAHAEIVAIRDAAKRVGNYRLTGATLCVTIEPCLMCVGALVHARIGTLVYGAAEPRSGAVVSTVRGGELPGHNHRFEVVSGVREDDCRAVMQAFFRDRRG